MAEPPELEDSEFLALCAQYLDLKFDLVQDRHEPDGCFSSPGSNDTDRDTTRHSKESASTARTTPLRPRPSVEESGLRTVPSFLLHVQHSDLSHASKDSFRSLANHIMEMNSLLRSVNRLRSETFDAMVDHANAMYTQVRRSSEQVQEQINNIAYVKTLAPFEIHPTPIDIWCNYRQKMQLIVKYTTLPCRTELVLIKHLAHVFDAHVYHPFLLSTHQKRRPYNVENAVNLAYDAIMTLLHKYKVWCKAMKDIKQNHIQPALRCIQNSPEILLSIRESEARQEAAKAVVRKENAPGTQPLDARARLILEQRNRSKHIPAKTKNKFRREQTV